jgi:hypothetical protein
MTDASAGLVSRTIHVIHPYVGVEHQDCELRRGGAFVHRTSFQCRTLEKAFLLTPEACCCPARDWRKAAPYTISTERIRTAKSRFILHNCTISDIRFFFAPQNTVRALTACHK